MDYVTQEELDRINALYHKSKTAEGLTKAEREEQKELRAKYIAAVRASLRGTLDRVDILEDDGSVTSLGEKYGQKSKTGV